jgi:hypothetical protein
MGAALDADRIQAWVGCGLVAASLFLKMAVEERLMLETFGAEYEAYAAEVGKIVPWSYGRRKFSKRRTVPGAGRRPGR